tara:strand:- start:10022 stop:10372 length:351 start_codon:yes stop_codon:yes gene_type:complete
MTKRRKLNKTKYFIVDENKNHKSVHSDDETLDEYELFDTDGVDLFFRHIKKEVLLEYCLRTEAKKICFKRNDDSNCSCGKPCLVHRIYRHSHFKLNKNSTVWKEILHRDTEYVKNL